MLFILLLVFASMDAEADKAADLVTARRLIDSESFPKSQFGMVVEDANEDGSLVTTTGARYQIDRTRSQVTCWQRLGKSRECVSILLPSGSLEGAEV